jgi:iron complex outermembrane receptor protein
LHTSLCFYFNNFNIFQELNIMKLKHLALALSSIGMLTLAAGVSAQEIKKEDVKKKDETVQRITVTGSNLKRALKETASPIQVMSREEITRTGATSLTEVLTKISANIGGVSENNTNGFSAGAQSLNLRGIGTQATLMLINGRRLATYAQPEFQTTFVDMNSIPVGAVERIEILKDGASAIYGSEAMAGVVNIILRDSYVGVDIGGSYAVSDKNDGEQMRSSLSMGYGDLAQDKFNVYATIDVRQRKPTFVSRRDGYLGTQDLRAWGYKDNRSVYSFPGNLYWTDKATGKFVMRPIDNAACPEKNLQPASNFFGPNSMGSACYFDDYRDGTFNAGGKTDRIGITSRASWQINADTTAFAEVMYNQNKALVTGNLHWVAGQTGQQTPALPITHPQYPKDLIDPVTGKTLAGGNGTVRVRAQLKDFPGQGQNNITDFGRYVAGVKGSFNNWDWETALMYNSSKVTSKASSGILATPFVEAYMNGTFLFGQSANNAALYSKIVTDTSSKFKSDMTLWDAKLTGELFKLPAGPVSIAVGAEARRESLSIDPDALSVAGELYHRAQSDPAFSRSRQIGSVYTELSIPVLKSLEASFAGRFDHYSDYGNSKTPKFGLKWTAMPELVFRGTYATGFRAPTLVENSDQIKKAFTSYKDPERCNATFLAGCQWNSAYESGSNPFLKPETAKSFTFGVIFEPTTWLSGTLDAWEIKRKDEISTYSLDNVLANPGRYTNNPAAVITRDPLTAADKAAGATAGEITNVRLLLTNVAETRVRGIDLNLHGKFNFGEYGQLFPKLDVTFMKSYLTAPAPGETQVEYAGTRNAPKLQATLGAGWRKAAWSLSADVTYQGKMASVDDFTQECVFATQGYAHLCKDIPSFTTVTLGASYSGFSFAKNLTLRASLQNAFNRTPPFAPSPTGGLGYSSLHSTLGRYAQVSVDYKFK